MYFSGRVGGVPEFRHVLDSDDQWFLLRHQALRRSDGHSVHGMSRLDRVQEDIGVDQGGHLPAIRVQGGAADGFVRQQGRLTVASSPLEKVARFLFSCRLRVNFSNLGGTDLVEGVHSGPDQFVDGTKVPGAHFLADKELGFGGDVDVHGVTLLLFPVYEI